MKNCVGLKSNSFKKGEGERQVYDTPTHTGRQMRGGGRLSRRRGVAAHVPSYHNPTSQYDDDDDEVVPFSRKKT